MCGILGVVRRGATAVDLDSGIACLRHRGPDAEGSVSVHLDGVEVLLGHTRLAILDLTSAGQQPMASSDGRWWLVFNGEIYNHLELRRNLERNWRGHSDTETVVEGLATWGIDAFLPRLNGMYALAAIDCQQHRLYLARDPFGIKPVYYAGEGVVFAFASEIRALRAIAGVGARVSEDALQTFLTLRYIPGPETLFGDIARLQPGHVLRLDLGSGFRHTRCFIEPVTDRFCGSFRDAVEVYRDTLRAAVQRQLLSDVPVGLLLSGGIDSALIGAFASEAGRALPAYTVGFGPQHAECELAHAAETAEVLGLPHEAITVDAESLWTALVKCASSVEEPLGTTSILPMWHLVERARRDVKVVLTGQGSDEPWGGYRRYQAELLREWLPCPAGLATLRPLLGVLRRVPELVRRGIASIPLADEAARFEAAYELFTAQERLALAGRADSGGARRTIRYWLAWLGRKGSILPTERMMRIDARMNLADDLLLYADKISMAVALEARVPMLDLELAHFIESLPLSYRVTLRRTKVVHKAMARSYLPPAIIQRKKRAFQVPFRAWSRGIWRERIEDMLLDTGMPHLDLVRRPSLEAIWREHLSGRRDFGRQLFSMLTLAVCLRQAARYGTMSRVTDVAHVPN
ncbi:MAG: asparagine synthase (glutamine-hydrolyzing) [Burkholderiales bacterium]|nr:asparagine synthase (glutamine-hydrolyzing) [Burkholderiales bacterium]